MNTAGSPVSPGRGRPWRLFVPILAGATLRERLVASVGALAGIALTGLVSTLLFPDAAAWPLIVGPIGASAVLIFAVPASPLAQPWPIIGGNTISALVGVTVALLVHEPVLAIGLAVSLAIVVMSLTRSLHPPGGATALIAVIGGPSVAAAGYSFALMPVAVNSVLLVILGLAFHGLTRRSYPHRPASAAANLHQTSDPPSATRVGFRAEDIDAALGALNETFDIDRGDLDRLLRQVELQALVRGNADLRCDAIMSRDVVSVGIDAAPGEARALLLDHNIRTLPVLDADGLLAGTVGLRELSSDAGRVGNLVSPAATASPVEPALGLLPALTDGRAHAVVVVDAGRRVLGMITQTDLLAAVAALLKR